MNTKTPKKTSNGQLDADLDAVHLTAEQELFREITYKRRASIGLCLIQTGEPEAVGRVLKQLAATTTIPDIGGKTSSPAKYSTWDIINGWRRHDIINENNGSSPIEGFPDTNAQAIMAWKAIGKVRDTAEGSIEKFTFMRHPSASLELHGHVVALFGVDKHIASGTPHIIELLRTVAYNIPAKKMWCFLIASPNFILPDELKSSICVLRYGKPDSKEVFDMVTNRIDKHREKFQIDFTEEQNKTLARGLAGSDGLQAENILAEAIARSQVKNEKGSPFAFSLDYEKMQGHINKARMEIVKQSESLEILTPIPEDQLGGMDRLKKWVKNHALAFTEKARKMNIDLPKGIALIGTPGCGKSVGARVIGYMLNMPIVRVDIASLFGGIVGQTEQRTANMFDQLDALAPAVVFVDEIDKAGLSPGGGGDSGTSSRILQRFLTHMSESNKGLFWVFTANRTTHLPAEFLRMGRLSGVFAVLPPTSIERRDVFKIHLAKRGLNIDDIDGFDRVIAESEGYVSSELEVAVIESMTEMLVTDEPISADMIISKIKEIKPISKAQKQDFDIVLRWARDNATLATTPDEATSKILALPDSMDDCDGMSVPREVK